MPTLGAIQAKFVDKPEGIIDLNPNKVHSVPALGLVSIPGPIASSDIRPHSAILQPKLSAQFVRQTQESNDMIAAYWRC
jgi:hypothetical protein